MGLNASGVMLSMSMGRSSVSASGQFWSMVHRLLNLLLLGSCHQSWRKVGKRKQYLEGLTEEQEDDYLQSP